VRLAGVHQPPKDDVIRHLCPSLGLNPLAIRLRLIRVRNKVVNGPVGVHRCVPFFEKLDELLGSRLQPALVKHESERFGERVLDGNANPIASICNQLSPQHNFPASHRGQEKFNSRLLAPTLLRNEPSATTSKGFLIVGTRVASSRLRLRGVSLCFWFSVA